MIRVVGFGAGGHAKVVIEILRSMQKYEIVGLLETQAKLWGTKVLEVEVLGDDMLMGELKNRGNNHAFIGLGTVGDAHPRRRLYETVSEFGFQIVPAIHTTAVISSSAQIGVGPTIMAGAVVNASAVIGDNVIVNTGAIVEHDCLVGDHAHIATGARLAGGVHVGACAHIGIGAVVRQEIRIGAGAIVGAGAVVVRDVPDKTTVVGVPAKIRASD
ncbi:MAG TPA: NeuD/PglB/VioB family sugar acetyltransferase [Pyrinomonadaceae bacterium]|nr:NeuD/PglB/VioB family sugar acetyltransferase [Pyrinomonadaceae bacterium]